ncbi:nucleus protein [Moniliophthora roreri MCA 2997]|uniref:Nucleus protein n=1 Tax=Moniliophthora roreri (strain MCA 2997) TaxID=1381753 RepID=V2XNR3_MONRO|nr:nucleus protein [Moniliophthora roreri MCA 2997]
MASTAPVKVLTVGSAVGSIKDLFAKVKAIDAKHGKFDFVLCIGDFFGRLGGGEDGSLEDQVSQLLNGEFEAPIECYIMQGENPIPDAVIQKFAKTGGELCKNVFLMSKSGLITTANGLRIACLGGVYNEEVFASAESAPGFASPFFSCQSVERLLSNALSTSSSKQDYKSLAAIQSSSSSTQVVDILISNTWPASIAQLSNSVPSPEVASIGAIPLDDVIRRLKPRYHFAACGGNPPTFWEREPFVWDDGGRISRFLSLGAFGGPSPTSGKKPRWFYAFSISPNSPQPKPANVTKNPFTESEPRQLKRSFDEAAGENYIWDKSQNGKPPPGYKCRRCESSEHFINDCPERQKPPEGYICRLCNTPGHFVRDCPTKHAVGDTGGRKPKEGYVCRACGSDAHYLDDCPVANQRHPGGGERGGRGKRGPPKEIDPSECWFCLSNPNLAKHLIVSLGSDCYVTLPKGQIIPTQSAADHVNVPGGGHVLIVPIDHHPTYSTIPLDISSSIIEDTEKYKSALRAFYAKHFCVPVFFEVGRISGKGGHAHVQAVPIPQKLKDKVEGAFISEGRTQGIDFEEDVDTALESCASGKGGYFRVDLPDGRKMVHLMKQHVPFGIQFGRQVIVNLLGMPDRMDWKACMLSEDEDRADADAFKKAFAPFTPDSTL